MTDQTVATIDAAPLPEVSSTFLQIAVLAALAATGTLATNILLPSLPLILTNAITLFLSLTIIALKIRYSRPGRG